MADVEETTVAEAEANIAEPEVEAAVEESVAAAEPVAETEVEATEEEAVAVAPAPATLDLALVGQLLAQNEAGQLSSQEFQRAVLLSLQSQLATQERLARLEQRLEELQFEIMFLLSFHCFLPLHIALI